MRGTGTVIASAARCATLYIAQAGRPSKVDVVYNAVDWSALQATQDARGDARGGGVPEGAPLVCIIARLTEQKAHRVLDRLRAARGLRTHLLVVGDGTCVTTRRTARPRWPEVRVTGAALTWATCWARRTSS
jgi:hypothetical protein